MTKDVIPTDEPTDIDKLNRQGYASTLARFAATCETPMVIGIYGEWGTGKTSLMQLVRNELSPQSGIRTIWFDPWLHQFNEHPAIGLVHTIAKTVGIQMELKETLVTIAEAFAAVNLNVMGTGIDFGKIFGAVRRRRERLRRHFWS